VEQLSRRYPLIAATYHDKWRYIDMSIGILIDIGQSITSVYSDVISFDFDVTQDEAHEWTNDVTQFPVEIGSPITDHIQPLPDKVTLSGMITNSAIGENALAEINGGDDRVQNAFELLLKLKEDRILLTVYTKHKIYTDMALKSVNLPRDASIGDSIKFKMEFVNVRLVDTQTVDVPDGISRKLDKKTGDDVKKKTEPPKAAGKVEPKPVEKSKGILKGILG
jgi:hypothetical protein